MKPLIKHMDRTTHCPSFMLNRRWPVLHLPDNPSDLFGFGQLQLLGVLQGQIQQHQRLFTVSRCAARQIIDPDLGAANQ